METDLEAYLIFDDTRLELRGGCQCGAVSCVYVNPKTEHLHWVVRSIKLGQENVTQLASITAEGVGACLAVEGSTTREVFGTYLERVLGPTLRSGQIGVMDDLSAHRGGMVRETVEGRGCEILYLPLYSPDLNPIEQVFSKVKGLMRKAGARTREALIGAIGRALEVVTAQDAWGFFGHCGYRSMGQLL